MHGVTLDTVAKIFLTSLLAYQSEHRRDTQLAPEYSALACSKVVARPAEESCASLEPLIGKVDQLVELQSRKVDFALGVLSGVAVGVFIGRWCTCRNHGPPARRRGHGRLEQRFE